MCFLNVFFFFQHLRFSKDPCAYQELLKNKVIDATIEITVA